MKIKLKPINKIMFFFMYLLSASLIFSCGSKPPIESDILVSHVPQITETVPSTQIPTKVIPTQPPQSVLPSPTVIVSAIVTNEYDHSVFTEEQKERLYQTSLGFIANTEEDAYGIGIYLDYSTYGNPGFVCGPLASGILRDAGLLDEQTNLKNFWLLNPRDEYTITSILELNFPRDKYFWFKTETALDQFDFVEFPLFTGDFLYFYAGYLGTYEHMLSITKVDDSGRVYAISNYLSEDQGYLIHEFMLYDPNDPGVGYFYEMADRSKSGGTTGFGGFELWRRTVPLNSP